MFDEYKKGSTWLRIGILLATLAALMVLPPTVRMVTGQFTESDPPRNPGYVDVPGPPHFRLLDRDSDGRVDCALQVPSLPWWRRGYARDGAVRCTGKWLQRMPDAMAALADESLMLRREYEFSISRMVDVDGDSHVDCVTYDGTWRYFEGAICPERLREDAEPLSDKERAAADRLLLVERTIHERWLDPSTSSP